MLLSERNLLYSFLSPSCRKINVDGVSLSKLRVNMTEESMRSAFVQSSEREHMKTRVHPNTSEICLPLVSGQSVMWKSVRVLFERLLLIGKHGTSHSWPTDLMQWRGHRRELVFCNLTAWQRFHTWTLSNQLVLAMTTDNSHRGP